MQPPLTDNNFKHAVDYDSQLLPYKFYHTSVMNGIPDVLFHWHNEFEINYVYGGTARYHIDYDYFNSQAGDIILIRPNAPHSIHPIEQRGHETDTLLFHLDMLGASHLDKTSMLYLQPLQTDVFKCVPRIQAQDPGYAEIRQCLLTIFELVRHQPPYFELPLKSRLFDLFYLLYRHRYIVRKNTDDMYRKNEKLRLLIEYIQQHYADNLTIEELANRMGYTKTHFMTVFKQQTGTSCMEFIIQVRLRAATELLTNTLKPVLEIATEVGFNNLSNFNRQFKQYYHTTPSNYRKQLRKNRAYTNFDK
ncbi:TPA: helix-turn-helix domain-containing protein [Streptococcus suis]